VSAIRNAINLQRRDTEELDKVARLFDRKIEIFSATRITSSKVEIDAWLGIHVDNKLRNLAEIAHVDKGMIDALKDWIKRDVIKGLTMNFTKTSE
jgi:hypothetical protein